MRREMLKKRGGIGTSASAQEKGSLDPDDLNVLVREGLTAMTIAERASFILALERELRATQFSIRLYLFTLGISATSPQDMTPGDVGHLIRFLKLNVPRVKHVVDRVAGLFTDFPEDQRLAKPGDPLAA